MICISFLKILGYLTPYNPPPRLPAYKSPTPSSFLVPGPARLILNAYYKRSVANKGKHKEEVRGERGRGVSCAHRVRGTAPFPRVSALTPVLLRVKVPRVGQAGLP